MTYKELQDAVMTVRFDEDDRPRIKSWLDLRYQWIWSQANWTFKYVSLAPLAVTSGDATPAMLPDFAKAQSLFDELGNPLVYVDPDDFDFLTAQPTTFGRPSLYTVANRQISIFPAPSANVNYKLSYTRRLSHVDPILGIVGGTMQVDDDQPLWPAEHDYVLVIDTAILGQQISNDPY